MSKFSVTGCVRHCWRRLTFGLARNLQEVGEYWLNHLVDPIHAKLVRDLEIDVEEVITRHDPMDLLTDEGGGCYRGEAHLLAKSLMMAATLRQVDLIVQSVMILKFTPVRRSWPSLNEELFLLVEKYRSYQEYECQRRSSKEEPSDHE